MAKFRHALSQEHTAHLDPIKAWHQWMDSTEKSASLGQELGVFPVPLSPNGYSQGSENSLEGT